MKMSDTQNNVHAAWGYIYARLEKKYPAAYRRA